MKYKLLVYTPNNNIIYNHEVFELARSINYSFNKEIKTVKLRFLKHTQHISHHNFKYDEYLNPLFLYFFEIHNDHCFLIHEMYLTIFEFNACILNTVDKEVILNDNSRYKIIKKKYKSIEDFVAVKMLDKI